MKGIANSAHSNTVEPLIKDTLNIEKPLQTTHSDIPYIFTSKGDDLSKNG